MKTLLSKFHDDPDWILVEEILKDCLKTVSYHPDSTTAPTDFKSQVLANKRLHNAVLEFLGNAKVINSDYQTNEEMFK